MKSPLPLLAALLLTPLATMQAADVTGSLPRSLPVTEGVDPVGIEHFLETMEERRFELHSFMLLRHGKVVAETWWAPYAPEVPHCLYSLSKSFTSTAVGLAAAEGRLSLDDKVISFFPESLPPQVSDHLAAMRVRDLLCMAAGHEKDPQNEMVKSDDWVRAFLAQPLVRAPGTHFVYSSAATYMCSAIVQKVTGMTVLDYLRPRLFEPLQITGVTWDTCPRGINTGGWGLSVTTEGLAKFGQLYLQKGNWQGRQILPAAWVEEATSFQIQQPAKPGSTRPKEEDDQRQGYGYQFWRCRHNAVRADGAFGQLTVMMPDQDAVVVMTSESRDLLEQLGLVWEHLLPSFRDAKLPADDVAQEKLTRHLSTRHLSTRHLAPNTGVSGPSGRQVFAVEENSLGINRLTISNAGQTVTLTAQVGDTGHCIVHGLDEWRLGDTAMPGTPTRLGAGTLATPTRKVAASAAWLDASTLELTWRYLEFPHRDTVTCRFDADRVTLSFLSSITVLGRAAPTRPTLTGKKLEP
jgi:CubicO group peptidase (beta-lactamase class C family)